MQVASKKRKKRETWALRLKRLRVNFTVKLTSEALLLVIVLWSTIDRLQPTIVSAITR